MFRALAGLLPWLMACHLVSFTPLAAEEVTLVAGHTVDHYVEQLQSEDRVVRLRAARSLGPFGAAAGEALRQALDHDDAAVRFIAAEQLGRIGGDSLEAAVGRLCELADDESSHAVRLAASFALCRHGLYDMHLPLLIESLDYPERGMACTAAYLDRRDRTGREGGRKGRSSRLSKRTDPVAAKGITTSAVPRSNALRKIRGE